MKPITKNKKKTTKLLKMEQAQRLSDVPHTNKDNILTTEEKRAILHLRSCREYQVDYFDDHQNNINPEFYKNLLLKQSKSQSLDPDASDLLAKTILEVFRDDNIG